MGIMIEIDEVPERCKQLREEIKRQEDLGNKLTVLELKRELDFLIDNFPSECCGYDVKIRLLGRF